MNIKSILSTVGKISFPFIATAATAGNPLIGLAAKFVGDRLGIAKVESTPEGIDAAISQAQIKDPDALLKLQESDHEFQEYMTKLGFDSIEKMEQVAAGDRSDARAREIAVRDNTPKVLAYVVTAGFFGLIIGLFAFPIPKDSQPIIYSMVGVLGTAWIAIITYFYGSSAGSLGKNATVDKAHEIISNLIQSPSMSE